MTYHIKRFQIEHIDQLDIRDELKAEAYHIRDNKMYHDVYLKGFPFYTLFHEDQALMIYGFHNGGTGTYMPLVLISKHAAKHKFVLIRTIFKYATETLGSDARRIEANVCATDKNAIRFAKLFGFEMIGLRRCATIKGEDEIIFERLQFGRLINGSH